ncbi:TetR/AcrR family transcriptional regulator [uncultured Methylobacterium sp.]|uniref:TetR/AcrR family transcriptional regulator n=1 Tax=uncultured Methylobacterium sp. TaxID=157278 RepID=UPI0035CAA8D5
MTISEKTGTRLRRSPDAVRDAAVACARRLLLAHGPEALTLPMVARDLGMTHGNLTHHFGSIGALHRALIAAMAQEVAGAVEAAAPGFRRGTVPAGAVVEAVFRAFDEDGAGRLVAWLAATGRMEGLEPLFAAVSRSVAALRADEPTGADPETEGAGIIAAALLTSALGAALIGAPLQRAAGLAPGTLAGLAADAIERLRATPP